MKNFALRRFGQVVRRDLLENRKRNLRYLLSIYVGCLAIETVIFYKPSLHGIARWWLAQAGWRHWSSPELFRAEAESLWFADVVPAFFLFLAFVLLLAASCVFENLKTKTGRIAYLTLPATNAEKYLSRYLWATVGVAVAFVVAFVAADLTRMALFPLFGHGFGSMVPSFFERFVGCGQFSHAVRSAFPASLDYVLFFLFFVELGLFVHVVYLLGGTLLRKHPFLMTTLAGIAFLAMLAIVKDYGAFFWLKNFRVDTTVRLVGTDVFLLALIVGGYWVSYRAFTRIQVVGRKKWLL